MAGDHPIRQMPFFIDLKRAQHRQIEMPAADQPKGKGRVDGRRPRHERHEPPACVGQVAVGHALWRAMAHADGAVFGLKEHAHVFVEIIQHQGRDADAEIHKASGGDFLRNTTRNEDFRVHDCRSYAEVLMT